MRAWIRDDMEPTEAERLLLERRAARVRNKRVAQQEQEMAWIAELLIGGEVYAFHLELVRAALPLRMVAPVPLAPSYVVGIARHEGRMISVLSLLSLLGIRGWRTDPKVLLLLEPEPGRLCAVDSEEVPHAHAVPKQLVDRAVSLSSDAIVTFATKDLRRINLVHDFAKLTSQAPGGAQRAG